MAEQFPVHRARLVFDPIELQYQFGLEHPLQPARVQALIDLLERANLWNRNDVRTRLEARQASDAELGLIHTPDYIAAVRHLSDATIDQQEHMRLSMRYGFGDGDTPALPDMHRVCATIAGGTLVALSAVMGLPEGGSFAAEHEAPLHVFHPAGGLHHAWAERASGFCVYNDAAISIAHVLRASEAKILYIDFDAHHGDGVQRAFYDDPRVMTVSFHETGRYLFPGSGEVLEMGVGSGHGYAVNIPLEPFTEDDSYIEMMDELLMPLVTGFAPDVLITQHGCDTHAWDPLTHLYLTTRGIVAQIKSAHQLAHTFCGGRWVALGGGGYDLYRVVPRAWGLLWAEMSEQQVPEQLPWDWVERWRVEWEKDRARTEMAQDVMGKPEAERQFPSTFLDQAGDFPAIFRRAEISHTNRLTVGLVRHLVVPPTVRQAFARTRPRSPLAGLFDLLHLNKESVPSRSRTLSTRGGPILMRDFCPPSLVERLRAESGLRSFARIPEREHQLLLEIARGSDCALALAHTPTGEIVG
ncbi:MAG: acetoin utilization protein AcuC, partial [Ktedonobacteraceae bacterium]|nr:acetoin utilization protein AcuC [Ktedonobacteraceae bacterium]